MCGDLLRKWLVLVVCTCGVAAAGEPVPEPNTPWIADRHLAPIWESMALATRYYNQGLVTDRPMPPSRSVSLTGRMNVIDPNGLIGLSEVATNTYAFDEAGRSIDVVMAPQSRFDCECRLHGPSYQPLEYSMRLEPEPFHFTIDMAMERNAPFPTVLSRLVWSMSALLSDRIEVFDIPFAPTADWTELVPGLEVLVEQAAVEQGKYSYQMKARYDPNRVSYLDARDSPSCPKGLTYDGPYSWPWNAYPEMIVTAVDVVDAKGNSVFVQSPGRLSLTGGTGFHDSGGQRIVTMQYTGTCSECGKAALIRHVIAFKPYNQELQFVLENVPVPTE